MLVTILLRSFYLPCCVEWVWNLVSHTKRTTDWCLTTGWWWEYLDLRGKKWREDGEDCIMRSFITCTIHKILLGWSNQGGLRSHVYRGLFPQGVRRQGREPDHSPKSIAEVKNAEWWTSTPPYVFMWWCLIKYRIWLHGVVLSKAQGHLYRNFSTCKHTQHPFQRKCETAHA